MPRPPLDPEAMRALAARMAKGRPQIREQLRWFIDGKATARDSVGAFRRAAHALLFSGDYNIDHQLRVDLGQWGAKYSLDVRGTDDPFVSRTTTRWRAGELDAITKAAKLRELDFGEYVRLAANLLAEQDLAEEKKTKAA